MIKPLSLAILHERFGGELVNGDASFDKLATDTRKTAKDALFIAIKGENFDAHDYLAQAAAQGACAIVADKQAREKLDGLSVPIWLVDNTIEALGHIARAQRDNYQGVLFAITGSNGKTSVKGMLESICCAAVGQEQVFATAGNFNNHLGVPLSLLAINPQCQYAVIEMGASAVGEIDYLSHMAQPHYSVVNNVSPAHVEGFGSVDNIALAKAEIYDHLVDNGVAIINADDHYAPAWFTKNKQRKVTSFSREDSSADVYVHHHSMNAQHCYRFSLTFKGQSVDVQLKVLGEHAIMNAAAAASLALSAGIGIEYIKTGLEKFTGVAGRLQISEDSQGNTLIDDTYNASPKSMRAAIDTLAGFTQQKILVMGDMGELGQSAIDEHEAIGHYARAKGIHYFFSLGQLSKHAAIAFGENGIFSMQFDELIQKLMPYLVQPSCVLVKGSRSTKMERVIHYLKKVGEVDASLVS